MQGDDARSRSDSYVVPTRITVREYLLKEWLPAIKGTVRPTTFASYATHVEGHIVPALGSLQLSRLSAQAINAFYARLLENGRLQGKGSLSPATVRRVHATLHRALKDAVRWQRLAVNPVDAADPPRGQSKAAGAARLERRAAGRLSLLRQG